MVTLSLLRWTQCHLRSAHRGLLCGFLCSVYLVCASAIPDCTAQESWLTGSNRLKQRSSPVSLTWVGGPLGAQLSKFSRQKKIAIYLDPRVDSSLKQSLAVRNQTVEQVVWKVATANDLGVAAVGDVLYVGPKNTTDRLPIVIEDLSKQLRKSKTVDRKKWIARKETRWEVASSTKEIVQQFENEGLAFVDPDGLVTFDVLPGLDLPKLNGCERVSLFLAGLGAALKIDESSDAPTVVSFPDFETAKFGVLVEPGVEIPKQFAGLWKKSRGKRVLLDGDVGEISKFIQWQVQSQKSAGADGGTAVFSLEVTQSRGAILKTIALKTGRAFEFDPASAEALNQGVNVNVSDASFEELVGACLIGSQLKVEITDDALKVTR